MWQKFLTDARFHEALLEIDRQIAAEARERDCPQCGGVLHVAWFRRKPRGPRLPEEHEIRLSFCCAQEGCRKRVTPASVRFLGRRVYWATIVVLVPVLRQGPNPTRLQWFQELLGVTGRTVERWCKWWRTVFVESEFWRMSRARLAAPVAEAMLPASLLERFGEGDGGPGGRLLALLRFLAPISGGTVSQGI